MWARSGWYGYVRLVHEYMTWIWIFVCFLSTPKKFGRWTWILRYFSKFGPTWFSCLKKHTENCDESRVKNTVRWFSTNISIAENRRVDSWQHFSFQPPLPSSLGSVFFSPWGSMMEVSWSCYPGYWRSPLDDESSGTCEVSWILKVDLSTLRSMRSS